MGAGFLMPKSSYSSTTFGQLAGRTIDLDDEGTETRFVAPVGESVTGTAQVELIDGTGSAFVLTVVVSNDPAMKQFESHPAGVTLTNTAKITEAFSIAGYLWWGVRLTTVNSGNLQAHVHLCATTSTA